MRTAKDNFSSLPLESGSYGPDNMGSGATINSIKCISDGQIIIYALGGGSFIWNATRNKIVNVLSKNVIINSGMFLGFFDSDHTPLRDNSTPPVPFMWVDEAGNYFVDENGDNFILI